MNDDYVFKKIAEQLTSSKEGKGSHSLLAALCIAKNILVIICTTKHNPNKDLKFQKMTKTSR